MFKLSLDSCHLNTILYNMKQTAKKRLKLKFAVTHRNIKLRFDAEKKKNPEYTLNDMARLFGTMNAKGEPVKQVVWRWMQKDKYSDRLPNTTYRCPHCDMTQHDRVSDWINDDSIKINRGGK